MCVECTVAFLGGTRKVLLLLLVLHFVVSERTTVLERFTTSLASVGLQLQK